MLRPSVLAYAISYITAGINCSPQKGEKKLEKAMELARLIQSTGSFKTIRICFVFCVGVPSCWNHWSISRISEFSPSNISCLKIHQKYADKICWRYHAATYLKPKFLFFIFVIPRKHIAVCESSSISLKNFYLILWIGSTHILKRSSEFSCSHHHAGFVTLIIFMDKRQLQQCAAMSCVCRIFIYLIWSVLRFTEGVINS